jgi:leukotriene-A4 hydrolase
MLTYAHAQVWAEPSVVDAAAYEFAEVTQYLDAAEALAGPYRWGQYDLLLLPPSFPYGARTHTLRSLLQPIIPIVAMCKRAL